jgi:hypothetical protein
MLTWQGTGGFSIDASVRIEGHDHQAWSATTCIGKRCPPRQRFALLTEWRARVTTLGRPQPDDPQMRTLARLVQARRGAVDLRTRLTQELRAELQGYFPQPLAWTGNDLARSLVIFSFQWAVTNFFHGTSGTTPAKGRAQVPPDAGSRPGGGVPDATPFPSGCPG